MRVKSSVGSDLHVLSVASKCSQLMFLGYVEQSNYTLFTTSDNQLTVLSE